MRSTAKTPQEALYLGALQLKRSVLDVDFEIIDQGRLGLFGLFAKKAVVDVKINPIKDMNKAIKIGLKMLLKHPFLHIEKYEYFIHKNLLVLSLHSSKAKHIIGANAKKYQSLHHLISLWLEDKFNLSLRLEVGGHLKKTYLKIQAYCDELLILIEKEASTKSKSFYPYEIDILLELLHKKQADLDIKIHSEKDKKYLLIKPCKTQ